MESKKETISEEIRNRIIAGSLQEYATLRISDCASQHRVNRKTVADALRILVGDGLLVPRAGVGYAIAAGAREIATAAAMDSLAGEVPALVARAKALGLEKPKFLVMVENAWRNK